MASQNSNIGSSKKPSSAMFFACAVAVFVLDQLTKLAVINNIPWEAGNPTYHFYGSSQPIPIIEDFLYIVHITNEGAAWGILSGRTYLLTSIAVIALLAMWFFRKYLGFDSKIGQIALGLFAGGVVGNLVDRSIYGHVIDFIDVHIPFVNYRWPAFNIADCGITVGVAIYILAAMAEEKTSSK